MTEGIKEVSRVLLLLLVVSDWVTATCMCSLFN